MEFIPQYMHACPKESLNMLLKYALNKNNKIVLPNSVTKSLSQL